MQVGWRAVIDGCTLDLFKFEPDMGSNF
jgi:hypothetical protein